MFQDLQLNFWFGTYENGLFKKDRETGKVEQIIAPEITSKIYTITEDNSGKLWLGCKGKMMSYNLISRKITNYKPDIAEVVHFGSIAVNDKTKYSQELLVKEFGLKAKMTINLEPSMMPVFKI